ncbi:MAG: amidohydrolase family protein [Chloroflexota bacterium]
MFELILRNAKLIDGRQVDIAIQQAAIMVVEANIPAKGERELDAEGHLTIPAFVNGQLHACKSFWRRLLKTLPKEIQQLSPFEAAAHVKPLYTQENVYARVDETMRLAIQNGTCAIRLFADVDELSGLTALKAMLAIRETYSQWMHVQVVAFPQDGILTASTPDLMRQALELGADVVGGIPWIEPNLDAQRAHVDMCFDLAKAFRRPLHFVCDDAANPQLKTLEMIAKRTIELHQQNVLLRVAATQCSALSFYDDRYAASVINLVKKADMIIFSNSHVSLIATDFDETQHPWPRSVTRIRQLLDAGVSVACGQDDIDNWFYPFGRNDMLEVAQFMAHSGRFAWNGEVKKVLPMVTSTPAAQFPNLQYGLQPGADANLVVLDASDWHGAVQFQADKRFVILRGRLAAETVSKTTLTL